MNSNFNKETVREGRKAELRKGYNGESMWGRITDVETFEKIDEIPKKIDKEKIIPNISSEKQFENEINRFLSGYEKYIAFKVVMDSYE